MIVGEQARDYTNQRELLGLDPEEIHLSMVDVIPYNLLEDLVKPLATGCLGVYESYHEVFVRVLNLANRKK